jgi:putative nucleotidyltransferase with HDIG domain
MSRSSRGSLNLELKPSEVPGTIAYHAVRWGLLLGLAVLTYLLFPVVGGFEAPLLVAGDVAQQEVIAPFDIEVRKSDAELAEETAELEASALPVLDFRADLIDSAVARSDSLFRALGSADSVAVMVRSARALGIGISTEEADYLADDTVRRAYADAIRRFLRAELRSGVVTNATAQTYASRLARVRRGSTESLVAIDSLPALQRILDRRGAYLDDLSHDALITRLLYGLAVATLVPNEEAYAETRAALRASVNPVKDSVLANERIIDANEVVTPSVEERLFALRQELVSRGGEREGRFSGIIGQILTNALLLTVFWALLQLYRPMIYESLRQMLALTTLMSLVIIGAAVLNRWVAVAPELVPVPFAAMLMTAMFRGRVAMVGTMVLALLLGSQVAYGGPDSTFIILIGGVAAAVSVRNVRRRDHFLLAAAVVAGAYLLAALAVKFRVDMPWVEVGLVLLRGGINAVASAALVSTLLPLFEALGGITTDLSLLELSDPDRPLLRRLATEAPGTYAHSIAMANLCESACNAVGGHGLLARVGCYYHDVGKVRKPQYFVENQARGANPHDKLKPEVSAGIVRNHVRDGVQLAEEHKLPDIIRSFIAEHHGTMQISYFLERARSRNGDDDVDEEEFRYPGPRPRSLETAVAMLADGVEAAVRVLDDPAPERVRDVIEHLVNQRVESGQLDDAPVTLAQLTVVREEFARVLGGALHNRIDYPETAGGIGAGWESRSNA